MICSGPVTLAKLINQLGHLHFLDQIQARINKVVPVIIALGPDIPNMVRAVTFPG